MDQERINELINERFVYGGFPSNEHCKSCAFKEVYIHSDGKVYDRHENPTCGKYPQGTSKPRDIIYNNAHCALYKPETAPAPQKSFDAPNPPGGEPSVLRESAFFDRKRAFYRRPELYY